MKEIETKKVELDLPVFEDENGDVWEPSGEFRDTLPYEEVCFLSSNRSLIFSLNGHYTQENHHIYKKRIWRAKEGEKYFYLSNDLNVNDMVDKHLLGDDLRFGARNYFKTEEQAVKAQEAVFKLLSDMAGE